MTDLNDFIKTDNFDHVMAAHVNDLIGASLRAEYSNVETLAATRTLLDVDTPVQRYDCDGADRLAKLPTPNTTTNHLFLLVNASSGTEILTVKNNDETVTHAALSPGEAYFGAPDGDGGYVTIAAPASDWKPITNTLTYATANTFTIAGDWTAFFKRGKKMYLTQTTLKYFSVVKSSYSAPNTTVTITGGSDYALASAAIVEPHYSNAENPDGFPDTFSWTPTFGGFTATVPTGTHLFRILPQGMYVDVQHSANGTSNNTHFSISAPPGVLFPASARLGLISTALDNGAVVTTTPGYVQSNAGGTQYDVVKEFSSSITGWTNANGKRCRFTIFHPIAS